MQGMRLECPACNSPFIAPSVPTAIPLPQPSPLPPDTSTSPYRVSEEINIQAGENENCSLAQRLGRLSFIAVIIVVATFAGTIGKEFANKFIHAASARRLKFTPSWKIQQWGRMFLEAPAEIAPYSPQLSPEERSAMSQLIENMDTGAMTTGAFELNVSRTSYRSSITPDLDGGAEGTVAQLAAMPGVYKPIHRITRTTVSGMPARRIEFTAERQIGRNSATFHLDGLMVIRGQELYAVQCIYHDGDDTAEEYAMRILKSVRLEP